MGADLYRSVKDVKMEHYVSAEAWRSGDGSKERPFKCISEAAEAAYPGDVINVLPGVYREAVDPPRGGNEKERIVYRSVVPGGAVITGAEISGENEEKPVRESCFFATAGGVDFITVSGFVMKDCGSGDTGVAGCVNARGWMIEDCEISGGKSAGVYFGADPGSGVFADEDGPGTGARLAQKQKLCMLSADTEGARYGKHIVRRCNIHDCEGGGIVTENGVCASVFEDNHIKAPGGADCFFLEGCVDVTIRRNNIENGVTGISFNYETQNVRVSQNVFHGNDIDMTLSGAHGPVISDNNLFLSERSIVTGSAGVSFVHNLIAGSVEAGEFSGESAFFFPGGNVIAGFSGAMSGELLFANNIISGDRSHSARAVFKCRDTGNYFFNGSKDDKDRVSFTLEEMKDGKLMLISGLYDDFPREGHDIISFDDVFSVHALKRFYKDMYTSGRFTEDYYGTHRAFNPLPGPFERPNPRFIVFDSSMTNEHRIREASVETLERDRASMLSGNVVLLNAEDVSVKIGGKDFHPQEIFISGNTAWIHGSETELLYEIDCAYGVSKTLKKWTMEAEDTIDCSVGGGVMKIAECVTLLLCMLTEGRRVNGERLSSALSEESAPLLKEYGIGMRLTPKYLKFIRNGEKRFLTLEEVVKIVGGNSVNYIAEVVEEK